MAQYHNRTVAAFVSVFVMCLLHSMNVVAVNTTSSIEINALRNLYNSTNGMSWNFNTLSKKLTSQGMTNLLGSIWFTSSQDPCWPTNFMGVACQCSSNVCTVSKIVLPSVGLKGSLPSIGVLSSLTQLSLPHNFLSGSIDWTDILLINKLQILDLHGNSLSCLIPESLSALTFLQTFDLSQNHCYGNLPKILGILPNLKYVSLFSNFFVGSIPDEWKALTKLEVLALQNNRISGILPSFGSGPAMPNLKHLLLAGNMLSGTIPISFGIGLNTIQSLDLSDNALVGQVPATLSSMKYIKSLRLSKNMFVSTKSVDGECLSSAIDFIDPGVQTHLHTLEIGSNMFTGRLDSALFSLPMLQKFTAEKNCFCGTIPSSVCGAHRLKTLIIDGMSTGENCRSYFFEGTAFFPLFNGFKSTPESFGLLPDCIWKLPNITTLQASSNGLFGTLPDSISATMKSVDLSNNHISGTLPNALNLHTLNMKNNRISGNLAMIENWANLPRTLDLTSNRLSGTVPLRLAAANNSSLRVLSGNVFSCNSIGELPSLDPAILNYSCGSDYFNFNVYNFFGLFGFVVLCASLAAMGRRHWHTIQIYWDEVLLWWRVSNGSMTILLAESNAEDEDSEETMRSLTRYTYGLERVRLLTIYLCSFTCVTLFPVYFSLRGNARKLAHTYLWSSTASFLTGSRATVVSMVLFCLTLFCFRWIMRHDKRLCKQRYLDMQKANPNQPAFLHDGKHSVFNFLLPHASDSESWFRRITIPVLRLSVIFLISAGTVAFANVAYLYIYFRPYSAAVKSTASVVLALFKIIWSNSGIPFLFLSPTLKMGVSDAVHLTFIKSVIGGDISLKFYLSLVIGVFIPLLIAVCQSSSCFLDVFFKLSPTQNAFSDEGCISFDASNNCLSEYTTIYTYEVEPGFVYNYTCTTNIMAAYVPMYIQVYTIMLAKSVIRFVYLIYSVRKFRGEMEGEACSALIPGFVTDCGTGSERTGVAIAGGDASHSKSSENGVVLNNTPSRRMIWVEKICNAITFVAAILALWFFDDSNTNVSNGNVKSTIKSFDAAYIVSRFSTVKLLWTYKDRRDAYMELKPEELKSSNLMAGAVCANSVLANYFGSVLIMCTFGIIAPLLSVVIACSTCIDTLMSQLTLGKFLTLEASAMLLHEHHANIAVMEEQQQQQVAHDESPLLPSTVERLVKPNERVPEDSSEENTKIVNSSLNANSLSGIELAVSAPGEMALKTMTSALSSGATTAAITSTSTDIFTPPSAANSTDNSSIVFSRNSSNNSLSREEQESMTSLYRHATIFSEGSSPRKTRAGSVVRSDASSRASRVSSISSSGSAIRRSRGVSVFAGDAGMAVISVPSIEEGIERARRFSTASAARTRSRRSESNQSAQSYDGSIRSSESVAGNAKMDSLGSNEGGVCDNSSQKSSHSDADNTLREVLTTESVVPFASNIMGSVTTETSEKANLLRATFPSSGLGSDASTAVLSDQRLPPKLGHLEAALETVAEGRESLVDVEEARRSSFTRSSDPVGPLVKEGGPPASSTSTDSAASLQKEQVTSDHDVAFAGPRLTLETPVKISHPPALSIVVNDQTTQSIARAPLALLAPSPLPIQTSSETPKSLPLSSPLESSPKTRSRQNSVFSVTSTFRSRVNSAFHAMTGVSARTSNDDARLSKAALAKSEAGHRDGDADSRRVEADVSAVENGNTNEAAAGYRQVSARNEPTLVEAPVQSLLLDRSIHKNSMFFTLQVTREYMDAMVAEADMPWGSMAAVKSVIAECSALPYSVVNLTRRITMCVACAFLSFVVNEVYNSEVLPDGGELAYSRAPALLMLLFMPVVELMDYAMTQLGAYDAVADFFAAHAVSDVTLKQADASIELADPTSANSLLSL